MKQGGQYYWYHNDHLGTPQIMTTTSGAVVWSAKYTSFGKATVDSASIILNPLRFPGQYEDAETGLNYNYFRYYDSIYGRYLRVDPISINGGINYFLYSLNNPINKYDSIGLSPFTDIVSIIPVIGTIYNIFSSPPGINISDYNISYNPNSVDPVGDCKKNVLFQAAGFSSNFTTLTFFHDLIDVVGAGASAVAGALPVTVVLTVDAVIDTGVTFYKLSKINDASKEANRKCEENNKQNNSSCPTN